MAVTRSWTTAGATPALISVEPARHPGAGLAWLVYASVLVAAGIGMAYLAKVPALNTTEHLVNLNRTASSEELLPLLESYSDRVERETVAQTVFEFLDRRRPLPNAGALSALRRTHRLPLARIKPMIMVRTPGEFQLELLRWCGLYFAGFYLVALFWRASRFRGDRALLAPLHLLTGIGLILMLSMRDPLRDTLEFHKFAVGREANELWYLHRCV